jgi:hypothetical protein
MPDGYFLGPGGPNGTGTLGAPFHRTDWLFYRAGKYGEIPSISNDDRAAARADLRYWNIQALFLADGITGDNGPDFRAAVEIAARDLFGDPIRVQDVWVWRIRPGVDPVDKDQER